MLLLGLGHRARQGKDLAAESIKHYYDAKNEASLMHVASWKGSVRVGVFKYATALYQEVNEFLKYYQFFAKVSGMHLPTNAPIEWPRKGSFKVGEEMTEGTVIFDAEWYPLGTKMIDIPEWVEFDPNAQKSELAPYGKHPKLLQWWGTEYRRQFFGQDYWIKKLFATIPGNLHIALISDMRFLDEAAAIKERGGYTVNVQRLNADGTQYYAPDRPRDHRSETELDGYDYDYFIKSKEGSQALTGEQAITLAEYLKALNERKQ